jgi:energy-coupling factor transport system ATP-binding protein
MRGEWHGSLNVDGQDVTRIGTSTLSRSTAVVSPDVMRWPLMTRAADQVAFGLENRQTAHAQMPASVIAALDSFGLPADMRVDQMSAGQLQRLALAAAFAIRASLLILDGPTDYLDASRRSDLLALLTEQSRRRDQTIILCDRHAGDLFDLADKVLFLDDGRQAYFGPPSDATEGVTQRLARVGGWRPSQWTGSNSVVTTSLEKAPASTEPMPGIHHPLLVARGVAMGPVRTFDLELRAGERVALAGDNGAGASLLLRTLAGEQRLERGTVLVGDGTEAPVLNPTRVSARRYRRLVGFMHEWPQGVPLTRALYREVSGGSDARSDQLAWADLTQVLARFAPHLPAAARPGSLGTGAARLAQLARLLWNAPGVCLLDQPEVGLDERGWALLVEILDEMQALGQAQLIVTHDPNLQATAHRAIRLGEA